MSQELTTKSASELAALMRSRSVSPVEVAEAHLQQIERVNPSLNAIVTIAENVMDQARAAEIALTKREEIGSLHGVPLTVKDTIDTQGLRTTSGSRLRMNFVPARDATVVNRLKTAGAIILGKTNTSEMAIPYESDNPVFGRTNNPRARHRTPGGSSGGEAAAIAACLSPAGIGSELSGSIRVPAHFCGIAGLKPTPGLVPTDGHVPDVSGIMTLGACIGPMARHVEDLRLLFSVITGASQLEKSAPEQGAGRLGAWRAAWYADDGIAPVSDETRAAVEAAAQALSAAGFEVREERPPAVSQGSRLWIELFSRAARGQLRKFYRGREDEAGPRVSALLHQSVTEPSGLQDKINAAEITAKAVVEREHLREEILRWMKTTPLILAPVGATPAFEHGADRVEVQGQSVSVFRAFSYSQAFNVFGLPSLVVPAGRSADGLPIGVQIVSRPFAEEAVLAAGAAIEKALGGWKP